VRAARLSALLLLLAASAFAQDTIILSYHEVDPTPTRGWAVTREDFADQMRYLAKSGYNVIPISSLTDYLSGRRTSLPPSAIVITSDDGWVCNYTEMFPLLKRLNFPWSLYIYPQIVGQGSHAVTWKQIQELDAEGVDIESHTMSHAHLTRKSHPEMSDAQYDAFLKDELEDSRNALENHLGHPVHIIAYPYGEYDNLVTAAARKAGYTAGLVTWARRNDRQTDPMKLGRVKVESTTSLDDFRTALGADTIQFKQASPSAGEVLERGQKELWATIDDATLDPATVHAVFLSETTATFAYDRQSHRVSVTVADALAGGRQTVLVQAMTREGHRAAGIWTFYGSAAAKRRYAAQRASLAKLPRLEGDPPHP